MKHEPENSVVHLSRSGIKPPPTRIMQHVSSPQTGGAILLSRKTVTSSVVQTTPTRSAGVVRSADLTSQSFSVTRARAHAQVRASAHAYAHARKDGGALRRVLDAALSGGDVRVAAVRPSSALTRFFTWMLIPAMLIAPLAPAYANEAPLADRVASDVAAIVADSSVAAAAPAPDTALAATASADTPAVDASPVASDATPTTDAPAANASPATTDAAPAVDASASLPATLDTSVASTPAPGADAPATNADATTTETPVMIGPSPAPTSDASDAAPVAVASSTPVADNSGGASSASALDTAPQNSGGTASADAPTSAAVIPEEGTSSSPATSEVTPVFDSNSSTTASTTIAVDDSTQTDTMASTTADGETPIFDIAPDDVVNNVDAIRARLRSEMRGQLRDEVRNEVKQEVRREVEEEVYRGCKNLDGTGYYCIPDAKSFGSPVIANERSISVVVQPDPVTGNKQIFLVRGESTIQLTHGTDDNVFPTLDPSSDMLVWQSLQNGRWQIAYAHVNDVGVPKVKYLTNGENNFNPKIYAGRIVWQAWVDGNWEIFTATPAVEKIPDDALSAEHRAAGVDGSWLVKRITANNAPDMFPSVTGDTITWQAIDNGTWQVFAYDLNTGTAHRVSKPGVKSESPKVALVWNEEDANGQMRMVGSSVDGSESFDITALARRLVDNTRNQPKAPVSNTEIVVATPVVVRSESDASSTASTTPIMN